jgi:hypothetical protein
LKLFEPNYESFTVCLSTEAYLGLSNKRL